MSASTLVYLSLGSNLGDRVANLQAAIAQLHSSDFQVKRASGVVESAPMYLVDQPTFLNLVVEVDTTTSPDRALARTGQVERDLGRERAAPNGPRTIDIDIVLFGESVVSTPQLTVPHPRMAERRFVLEPLAELAPSLRHPVLNRTVEELLTDVSDQLVRPYPARITLPVLLG